jgi:hypothetical protein
VNRAIEPDARLSDERPEGALLGKDKARVVYRMCKQDMAVTLFHAREGQPIVELALGSEARSFTLSEFAHFLPTMIEIGPHSDIAELESGEALHRIRRKR